ncbi:gamma-glutamylcyclotransferase [Ramlibacter sp. WS9]|uniref:gamma-glutamylcyclotransferase family protein n=1 Tax=Ramlibacter sp. WS9 TaxID=1882741 RepID=UPI001142CF3F|nr:gamma-glutamylcyclotransferase family protein [Ramlibacter sp. WS9]ROZ63900.1 gamma-glutamylcyclotransferase [Ramlibacter sp. WS9]
MHLVFVFGTLKEGFPNFHVNQGARVPGEFVTVDRFPLYLVGERCSPWLVHSAGEGHQVAGQVFQVDDAALSLMDQLERVGEPDGYVRASIEVELRGASRGAPRSVFAYLKPPAQFTLADVRHGPLAEYALDHAALYRSRV